MRIYIKAQTLSIGIILVDLVSSSHPTALCCTSCHILITTARLPELERGSGRCNCDEKTAQTFLDQSLSQELLLDGKEDAVTFICSKTDGISLNKASANLNIGNDLLRKSHDASRRLEACELEEPRAPVFVQRPSGMAELMSRMTDRMPTVWHFPPPCHWLNTPLPLAEHPPAIG